MTSFPLPTSIVGAYRPQLSALAVVAALTLLGGCNVFVDTEPNERACQGECPPGSVCEDGRCIVVTDVLDPDAEDASGDPGVDGDADVEQTINACGGTDELLLDGESTELGAACGACNDGFVICDGPDAVRCAAATAGNACGGCGPLGVTLGESCGDCGDGEWACDEEAGGPVCSGASEQNACGGCEELEGQPLNTCEDDSGVWYCSGPDAVHCVGPDRNACGGPRSAELTGQPGQPCGVCELGAWACDTTDLTGTTVVCENELRGQNECGGCGPLEAEPGTSDDRCPSGWSCAGPDQVVCDCDVRNACGGCAELDGSPGDACAFDGDADGTVFCAGRDNLVCGPPGSAICGGEDAPESAIGDPCGGADACAGGVVACVAFGRAGCVGERTPNACGGCGPLPGAPGSSCGAERAWACRGDSLVCAEADEVNACGGSEILEEVVGSPCGTCGSGTWTCDGIDAVACQGDLGEAARNACGGCEELDGIADEPCGTCDSGTWTCDGEEAVICEDDLGDDALNACGGCEPIDEAIGDACGTCDSGVWTCDGEDGATCESDLGDDALNACGGCGELDGEPGTECDDGIWRCDGESVDCVPDDGTNACGGTEALDGEPGTICGTCDSGRWRCDGAEAVACEGDLGDDARNECGGCETLRATVGDGCGTCESGAWTCDGSDDVVCDGDRGASALNSCGGCGELDGEPGTACDEGIWRCEGEVVACVPDDGTNACGGTEPLDGTPGDACGTCDSGAWACDGDDAVVCDGDLGVDALNACGGCEILDGTPDDACGTCNSGAWACDGDDAVVCDGDLEDDALNRCGGCEILDEIPGDSCGRCGSGRVVCDTEESVRCEGEVGEGESCFLLQTASFGATQAEAASDAYGYRLLDGTFGLTTARSERFQIQATFGAD